MKYTKLKELKASDFKRRTGVQKKTFNKMVDIVIKSEDKRKKLSGRPQKLSYEDQVLMTLEYLREYRTYFHIAHDYEISESNAYKIIKKVEDILIYSKEFRLPKKIEMITSNNIEVVLVDVAESPIERPQKNKGGTILERKSVTPLSHK